MQRVNDKGCSALFYTVSYGMALDVDVFMIDKSIIRTINAPGHVLLSRWPPSLYKQSGMALLGSPNK